MTKTLNVRVEEFERALNGEGRAAVDPTMKALVAVAGALAAIPTQPSAPFKESLRTKLMAEAAQLAAAAPAAAPAPAAPQIPTQLGPLKSLPKVLAKPAMQVASGGLAATIAVTGIGIGASRSLPGDPLYGLKRTVERLQDRTAGGTVAEAASVLEHAQTRIDEITALLERDGAAAVEQVEQTLADLKAELDKATADLLAQVQAGSRAAYEKLDATVTSLRAELDGLRGTLPPEAQDELGAVMQTLNGAAGVLGSLPKPPGPGVVVPTTPPLPTTPPATTVPPTSPPPTSGKPSTTPPTSPTSTSPSAPGTTGPIIKPPTTPVITTPPLPTLPVTLPPVLP
jgi:hypothetical protein